MVFKLISFLGFDLKQLLYDKLTKRDYQLKVTFDLKKSKGNQTPSNLSFLALMSYHKGYKHTSTFFL